MPKNLEQILKEPPEFVKGACLGECCPRYKQDWQKCESCINYPAWIEQICVCFEKDKLK